ASVALFSGHASQGASTITQQLARNFFLSPERTLMRKIKEAFLVIEVSNLRKSYGDRVLIDDLSFSVPKGAIVGIIGPNGAGKST
ncbi:transglycosylase domain-containing protein, partial [Salmonella enterica subsp. enterica serovar Montevideo]|nr:transglycosylase domain-containing protein [Salmonella enterica subsp. enterica serovar Montevideo]